MKPLVYVAGPYSRPDPVANTHNALRLAMRLYESGDVVPVVPHLTLFWHLIEPRPVEFWYEYDHHLLRRCDALFALPGESVGVENEVALARELGMPVFEDEGELIAWARDSAP